MTDPQPVVAVETKAWWKSRILWAGVAVFLLAINDALKSPGWAFDTVHLKIVLQALIGAAISILRAFAPDVLTGLKLFDGGN